MTHLYRKWHLNTSFGLLKDIILNYSNVSNFDFPIEGQSQILQLMYLQWSVLNWEIYEDLISKSTKDEELSGLQTDALCSYYDSHQKVIQSAFDPFETKDEVYLNILVVGNNNSWKSKFVSKYVGSKLSKLHEKSVSFKSNTKVMQSSGCIAVLNIIESPNLDKCKDQIADQLKDVHACIFVSELWTPEPLESVKEFTAANEKSLKKVEWVLWANSQAQSRDIDAKIMKLVSLHLFNYYEIWFDDKAQVEIVFTETVNWYA